MAKKNKDFYVSTMARCIQKTYECWQLDANPMYNIVRRYSNNALIAIHKIYSNLRAPDFFEADLLSFERPEYVYEAISSLIPSEKRIKVDVTIEDYSNQCKLSNIYIARRINLIMAILLFSEQFVLQPITSKDVFYTGTELVVHGDFVTFKVSKHEEKTYVSFEVENTMLLQFEILN